MVAVDVQRKQSFYRRFQRNCHNWMAEVSILLFVVTTLYYTYITFIIVPYLIIPILHNRYDHFAVLCEVLPSSIPSMVVNLLATTNGYMNQSLQTNLNEGLNCGIFGHNNEYDGDFLNLNNDPHLWDQFSRCSFPGNQFFRYLFKIIIFCSAKNVALTKFVRVILNNYSNAIRFFIFSGYCIGYTRLK